MKRTPKKNRSENERESGMGAETNKSSLGKLWGQRCITLRETDDYKRLFKIYHCASYYIILPLANLKGHSKDLSCLQQ